VLDNARVRVLRVKSAAAVSSHPAAVVVPLADGPTTKAGEAYWSGDRAGRQEGGGDLLIVEPKEATPAAGPSGPAPVEAGARPGQQPFTGMSFRPLFENDRVSVIRARMDVGAVEGFHTHASDVVVVYLSAGAIEDTADGKTKTNRSRPGDVEFEPRGSSHSARNVGHAIEAVLVVLKP
jgi:quercetin dioxygenase-like cupin family protein